MITRTQFNHIDWVLIGLLLLNSVIGVAIIYSSSHYLPGYFYLKQILWIFISLGALFIFIFIDYNFLLTFSPYFYVFCLFLLGLMLIFGTLIAGTKSWIKLPFLQIQPSEITKIALILLLARLFSEFKKRSISLGDGFLPGLVVMAPFILVSFQPDLGTATSYLILLFGIFIIAGVNRRILVFFLIFAILAGIVGWSFLLKEYQRERIKTLIFPEKDPLGAGYHIQQSKIAIGSGGFFGKGYKKGTQSQLRFLPARHTDFIFSVIGEEFGFVGVIVIFITYFLFLTRIFQTVGKSRDRAGVYVVFLVAMMLSCQFFINVLMTIGFFPIAGIPLPLLSYGGSSLFTNFLMVSLVINVKMRRFVNV